MDIELTKVQKDRGLQLEKCDDGWNYFLRAADGTCLGCFSDGFVMHRVAHAYSMGFLDGQAATREALQ